MPEQKIESNVSRHSISINYWYFGVSHEIKNRFMIDYSHEVLKIKLNSKLAWEK